MRKLLLSLFLISILVISGCSGSKKKTSLENPWIGGTEGILISFEENAPLAEVFDGADYPFGVVVRLKNEGEYPVPKQDVKVTISGINPPDFDRTEQSLMKNPDEDIEAKKKDVDKRVRNSNPVFVDFGDFKYKSQVVAQQPFKFRAEVCYKYQTTANSLVCVLKDNLDDEDALCVVNENKDIFNSGAPVQITDFKETSQGKNKIGFTFTVQHKGNGQIFEKGTQCDTSSRNFEDRVWVDVMTGITGQLKCSGLSGNNTSSGFVRLFSNEKIISCTQDVTTNTDFQQPVVVKLTYDYRDLKETTVVVKHQLS